MARRELPVPRANIVSSVHKMLGVNQDREAPFIGRKPKKGWFQAFLRRPKGLSVRKPKDISRSRLYR